MGTDDTTPSDPEDRWPLIREWREPGQYIRVTVDDQHRGCVSLEGRGSMPGARALVDLMERVRDEIGHEHKIAALVDLRKLTGSPLRAQFVIGKWLFSRKHQVSGIAVFGGKPIEMKLAKAIMKIARMRNASFFDHLAPALNFLGWPDDIYP